MKITYYIYFYAFLIEIRCLRACMWGTIAANNGSFQLSPIVFGIALTLFILTAYCIVRVVVNRRQLKNDTTIGSSKQSSSLLCNGVSGSGGVNGSSGASNVAATDNAEKVSIHKLIITGKSSSADKYARSFCIWMGESLRIYPSHDLEHILEKLYMRNSADL